MKEDKYVSDVMKQNSELQKQVDELLNRRIEPKIFYCHADALETCPKVQQAVEETAKEIWFKAKSLEQADDYDFPLFTFGQWLHEKFGIEVEE